MAAFSYDWRNWSEADKPLLDAIGTQRAAGNIEELCPSENMWHFRAVNEFGVEFISTISSPAVVKIMDRPCSPYGGEIIGCTGDTVTLCPDCGAVVPVAGKPGDGCTIPSHPKRTKEF